MRNLIIPVSLYFLAAVACTLMAEPPTEFFGDDEIEITVEQQDKLIELEYGLGMEIGVLKQQYEELEGIIEQKRRTYAAERLNILSDQQRKTLRHLRLERLQAERKTQMKRDLGFLNKIVAIMAKFEQIETLTVLEGKPRSTSADKASTDNSSLKALYGFEFYETPLGLSDEQKFTIVSLLQDYRTFGTYSGGKMCGGFHPDAIIHLECADEKIDVLVCLTCAEVRIKSEKIDEEFDLTEHSYDAIRQNLKPAVP